MDNKRKEKAHSIGISSEKRHAQDETGFLEDSESLAIDLEPKIQSAVSRARASLLLPGRQPNSSRLALSLLLRASTRVPRGEARIVVVCLREKRKGKKKRKIRVRESENDFETRVYCRDRLVAIYRNVSFSGSGDGDGQTFPRRKCLRAKPAFRVWVVASCRVPTIDSTPRGYAYTNCPIADSLNFHNVCKVAEKRG